MKLLNFLSEKIGFILFQFTFMFIVSVFLSIFKIPFVYNIVFISILGIYTFIYLLIEYLKEKKKYTKITKQVEELEEKYLIAEVIEAPKNLENKAYFCALKKACKAMNDKITKLEKEQEDFQEYTEIFAHEIKTPLASLLLEAENKKDLPTKEELEKINNLVEQMLYYERSKTPEKDYFVKQLQLENIIHTVLLYYKDYLLKGKITIEVNNVNKTIFTDEKWLVFILSQIIQNGVKYQDKKEKKIKIFAVEKESNIILKIKDNGCGIKKEDLPRVFNACFTGTNRKKEHATGMGLYLAKKLCNKLGLNIKIASEETIGTEVEIIFPKSKLHNLKE